MILNFSFKLIARKEKLCCHFSLYKSYRVFSHASADTLWEKLINLGDVSWNPLLDHTNAPRGLQAKPGIIYKAVTRLTPIPIRVFVEKVNPGELLSLRVLAIPGLQNRVTYQVESTLIGTYVSCSITLRGWLSPFLWWVIRPYASQVVRKLAQSAEAKEQLG